MDFSQIATTLARPALRLLLDLKKAQEYFREDKTQYSKRCYVRTLFAAIEGTLYCFKQLLLKKYKLEPTTLNDKEALKLEKDEQGKPYLNLLSGIEFTIPLVDRVFKTEMNLETGGNLWEYLKESNDIRNRITHPKDINTFDITDDEIKIIDDVADWYLNLSNHTLKSFLDKETNGF